MIIKHLKDYIDSINEGLIKTISGEIVLRSVLKALTDIHIDIEGKFEDNRIIIKINGFNIIPLSKIESLFDQIDILIVNRGGWFPSSMEAIKISGVKKSDRYSFTDIIQIHDEIKSLTIKYESKFDVECDNIPNKLYHLTIKEYLPKIKKWGLIPRTKSKLSSHLDRIYLCKTYQDCIDLIPKMMFYYTGEKDKNIYKLGKKFFKKDITPIIIEIDNSSRIINKIYIDINYDQRGYYTLSNIPPSNLKLISYI